MTESVEEVDNDYSDAFESFVSEDKRDSSRLSRRNRTSLASALDTCSNIDDSISESYGLKTLGSESAAPSYSLSFCSSNVSATAASQSTLRFSRHFSHKSSGSHVPSGGINVYTDTFESTDSIADKSDLSEFSLDTEQDQLVSTSSRDPNSKSINGDDSDSEQHSTSSLSENHNAEVESSTRNANERQWGSSGSSPTPNDDEPYLLKSVSLDLPVPVKESLAYKAPVGQNHAKELYDFVKLKLGLLQSPNEAQEKITSRSSWCRSPVVMALDKDAADVEQFARSKLHVVRKKSHQLRDARDVEHDAFYADNVRFASVDDDVWSRAVVSRLKLQNTLNRIEKACELKPETKCSHCQEDEDRAAFVTYLQTKLPLVGERRTMERFHQQLILQDPLSLIGETMSQINDLNFGPSSAMDQLLKPLREQRPNS